MSYGNSHYYEMTVFGDVSERDWADYVEYLKDRHSDDDLEIDATSGEVYLNNGDSDEWLAPEKLEELGLSYILKVSSGNEAHPEYSRNDITLYDAAREEKHSFMTDGGEPLISMAVAVDEERMPALREWYAFYKENENSILNIASATPAP